MPGLGGLVSQHALRQTPPGVTSTAADGTHPTGMLACCVFFFKHSLSRLNYFRHEVIALVHQDRYPLPSLFINTRPVVNKLLAQIGQLHFSRKVEKKKNFLVFQKLFPKAAIPCK